MPNHRLAVVLQLVFAAVLSWAESAAQSTTSGSEPATRGPSSFEMRLVATPAYAAADVRFDLEEEARRLRAWLEDGGKEQLRADLSAISLFHARTSRNGGPVSRYVRWRPHLARPQAASAEHPDRSAPPLGLDVPWVVPLEDPHPSGRKGDAAGPRVELVAVNMHAPRFDANDVDPASVRVVPRKDGRFEIRWSLRPERRAAFTEFTENADGQPLAVILDGVVETARLLQGPIRDGACVFVVGLRQDEAKRLAEGIDLAAKAAARAAAATEIVGFDKPDKLPASADPADLRAMQGAQAMLVAERKLQRLIKEGKIGDVDQILTFEEISNWPYEDGLQGMPREVRTLDGKKVLMTGFMLPIEEVENIREFLLVQSLWSCCYGQPPDINGIVRVVMKGNRRIDYQFDPIKVVGTFRIKATLEDGYCVDIYQLHADSVEVIR